MPVRVLQIVGSLRRGGTESWLFHVLQRTDQTKFQMDFLVEGESANGLEPEIRRLGSRVITCAGFSRPTFAWRLWKVLRHYGPYDVVHAHNNYHAGVSLAVAAAFGIRVRIAHSHSKLPKASGLKAAYEWLMLKSIRQCATERVAVSQDSANSFFGSGSEVQHQCRLLYCGIDLSVLAVPSGGSEARRELHIPAGALVIGHVGNFTPVKNHSFLVRIAREAMANNPSVWMLLVGDGATRQSIESMCCEWNIRERVVFTGVRADVQRFLRAMDVFVFPSSFEGLGLACVEAQATGLPVIASDGLPAELNVIPDLFQSLSLSCSPSKWASAALGALMRKKMPDAFHHLIGTPFDINISTTNLLRIYAEATQREDLETSPMSLAT